MTCFMRRFGSGWAEVEREVGDCEAVCREEVCCECCDGGYREGVCREDGGLEDGGSGGFAMGSSAGSFVSGGGRGVRITHPSIVQGGAGAGRWGDGMLSVAVFASRVAVAVRGFVATRGS